MKRTLKKLFGSLRQAAIHLGYTRASLYIWIKKGYIPDNAFRRWKAQGINYRGLGHFKKGK
jgi:hypothetical protein